MLVGLKKRYYLGLLRADADELMETDARALPRFLKAGDFVIDVGAFVGFYSQRLSRLVGPSGRVWSFEPMPLTYEILSASLQRLGLKNVRAFPCAVSDRDGAATMEVPGLQAAANHGGTHESSIGDRAKRSGDSILRPGRSIRCSRTPTVR